jgi:hypothetical protein
MTVVGLQTVGGHDPDRCTGCCGDHVPYLPLPPDHRASWVFSQLFVIFSSCNHAQNGRRLHNSSIHLLGPLALLFGNSVPFLSFLPLEVFSFLLGEVEGKLRPTSLQYLLKKVTVRQ